MLKTSWKAVPHPWAGGCETSVPKVVVGPPIHIVLQRVDNRIRACIPYTQLMQRRSLFFSFHQARTKRRGSLPESLSRRSSFSLIILSHFADTYLRSASSFALVIPATRRSRLGDRAFEVDGRSAWNSLPEFVTDCSSPLTFKKHIYFAYLFIARTT